MNKLPTDAEVEQAYREKIEQMARDGTVGRQMEDLAARVVACVAEESVKALPSFMESWPEIQKRLGEVQPWIKARLEPERAK